MFSKLYFIKLIKLTMKQFIMLLFSIILTASSYSQSVLVWSENYPANVSNDYSYPVSLSVENNLITLHGITISPEGKRLLVVNYNMQGDTLSSIRCGGDSISNNFLYDYKFNENKEMYILQSEQIEFYKTKLVVQKYDADGNFLWVSKISNPGDTSFAPSSLLLINDTCFFVSAYKEYNYPKPGDDFIETISIPMLLAYRTDGTLLWQTELNTDMELSYFQFPLFSHYDTAYIFGNTSTNEKNLIKVTADNTMTVFPDIELENGVGNIIFTQDNHMVISGSGFYRLSKLDLSGGQEWTQLYPTNLPSNVFGDEIIATLMDDASNIYITGRHYGDQYNTPEYTNADILTVKYDINGEKVWENRYEFGVNNADIGNRLDLKNGYLYVAGRSQRNGVGNHYDFIVLKIDNETGVTAGIYYFDGQMEGEDVLYGIKVLENDSLVIAGLSYNGVNYDWTTQLLSDVILSTDRPDRRLNYSLFPNPADRDGFITIAGEGFTDYRIISTIGVIVKTGKLLAQKKNQINFANITPGLYLISLSGANVETTGKLVIR